MVDNHTLSPRAAALLAAVNTLKAVGIDARLKSDHESHLTGHITLPTSQAVYDTLAMLLTAGIHATLSADGSCIQIAPIPGTPGLGLLEAMGEVIPVLTGV